MTRQILHHYAVGPHILTNRIATRKGQHYPALGKSQDARRGYDYQ